MNSSVGHLDGTLTGSTNPGQSGPESNDKEGVQNIHQSSTTGASPSDAVECHTQDTCSEMRVLTLCSRSILLPHRADDYTRNYEVKSLPYIFLLFTFSVHPSHLSLPSNFSFYCPLFIFLSYSIAFICV